MRSSEFIELRELGFEAWPVQAAPGSLLATEASPPPIRNRRKSLLDIAVFQASKNCSARGLPPLLLSLLLEESLDCRQQLFRVYGFFKHLRGGPVFSKDMLPPLRSHFRHPVGHPVTDEI
jgi:hypothetical protein